MNQFAYDFYLFVVFAYWALVSTSKVTTDDVKSWSLTVTPPYQKVAEGSKVIFTCESSLPTQVRFQWTKPAKPIKARDNVEIVQIAHNRSVLRIDKAHLRKHRRTFRCTAFYEDPMSQSVVDKSAQAVLKIVAKSKLTPNFPRVSSQIREQLVESRPGLVPLFCEVEQLWSKQTPTFTWIKDSVVDLRLEKDKWESDGDMQTLYVNSSQAAGKYQCAVFYKRGYVAAYSEEIEPNVIASYAKYCFAYDGSMVQDGERYQPREDPCETCVCEQGQPISCIVPRCQKPHLPCLNPLQIPGECCKFSCDEPTSLIDGGHADRACVSYNGTRVATQEMYAPESDPCKICTCDNGRPIRCMSVACAVPPMPCEDPKPVPGVCCKFTCEERVPVSPLLGRYCVAYNGTRVAAGEMYAPESDPCKICTCDNGLPVRCMSVGCAVPPMPCEDPKPVPGVCCKFTCEERVAVSQLFGKRCVSLNGTIINEGQLYSPDNDACKKCTCQNGQPVYCLSVGCVPPVMPCANRRQIPGECCKFTYCVSYNGTVVFEGDLYHPDSDVCKTCVCRKGNAVHCYIVDCMPPKLPCPNPRPIPGQCCNFTCERNISEIPINTGGCVSYNGTRIKEGQMYHPGEDFCKLCLCQNGGPGVCSVVDCNPVKMYCQTRMRPVPGTCCEFICDQPDNETISVDNGCLSYNGTMVPFGSRYQPTEDPCHICECSNGDSVCMLVRCAVPPMPCPNPRQLLDECCSFTCSGGEPEANRERDNLDTVQIRTFIQQIGPQDVIVQWQLPDTATFSNVSNVSISFASNQYSGHFEAEKGMEHVIVRGLNQSQLYNVVGVARGRQHKSVGLVNPAAFLLDTRATTSLNLLNAIGTIYESRGSYDHGSYSLPRPFAKVMVDDTIQVRLNLNTFNMVETTSYGGMPCPKAECGLLRFYMYNTTGHPHNIMSLMFTNDMDFKWAKAHL